MSNTTDSKHTATLRSFSYAAPVQHRGAAYPSSMATLQDEQGTETQSIIFADRDGNYYILDAQGNAHPALLTATLPTVEVLPPKVRDANLQKQAMLRAAGYDIPLDGSMDLYQQGLWQQLTTHPKQYDTTFMGLLSGLHDNATGSNTYQSNPLNQGEITKYNPDNIDWSKTRSSQSKVIRAMDGTWGPLVMAAMAAPSFISAPVATTVSAIGAGLGGYAADKASKAITGRDIATNVAMHTPLTPGLGEILNPGYAIGGITAERRMLDAIYNQVTPYGYGNNNIPVPGTISKTKELGLAMRDFFTPKKIDTSTNSIPAWKQRLGSYGLSEPLLLRDDAWRLATRQKPKTIDIDGKPHSLYIKNSDGTYKYDLDYINKRRVDAGLPTLASKEVPIDKSLEDLHTGQNYAVMGDNIAYNGGYSGIEFSLPKTWMEDNWTFNTKGDDIIKNIPFRVKDKWDLQPLKDSYRSFIPAITNFTIKHPNKLTNYIRNFEAVQAIGGRPFMLDMQIFPTEVSGIKLP